MTPVLIYVRVSRPLCKGDSPCAPLAKERITAGDRKRTGHSTLISGAQPSASPSSYLLLGLCNRNIPIPYHSLVISLQEERTRLALAAVQRSAGRPRDLDVVVNLHAIPCRRQIPSHQRDIETGPLAGLVPDVAQRRKMPVHCAHLVRGNGSALRPHLNLVTPAQIDSAIAVLRAVDLDVQLEIVELAPRLDIRRRGAALAFHHGVVVHQFAVARY